MDKKRYFSIAGIGIMSLGVWFSTPVYSENYVLASEIPSELETVKSNRTVEDSDYEYGKPLKIYESESTGVQVEIHATNPEEADILKQEKGWSDNEPIEIIKDEHTQDETQNYIDPQKNLSTVQQIQPLHADTSKWDLVGTEYWVMKDDYSIQTDTVWHSHGGDYKFTLPAHSAQSTDGFKAFGTAALWEQDPANGDDFVTNWRFEPSSVAVDYVVRGISKFTDGTNKEAEFYTRHYGNYSTGKMGYGELKNVKYYD